MIPNEYLHFEDNEVSTLDADGNVVASVRYDSPAEAKAAFLERVQQLTADQSVAIEYVDYQPKFVPQRLAIIKR